jgi:TP901 family phage tail tape measure protein
LFETYGMGVDFQFRHSGQSDIYQAITDLNNLYNRADKTAQEVDKLNQSFYNYAQGIQNVGRKMMLAGAGITATTGLAIRNASEFESALTGATKYMSDTSVKGIQSFNDALSESAKFLGITKIAILETAKEYMAMGLEQDVALTMAESVSYAGQVWDVLPAQAASAFKGIAAAYNMDMLAKDTRDNFIDMVNTVADYTALTGQDTLDFLSSAGAGLRLIGRTDMAGAMGIAAAARRAEVDVGHLAYGMRQITKTYAEKGEDIFSTIGVSIKDANNELIPFDQALAKASANINNYSQDVQSSFAMALGQRYSDDLLRVLGGWSEYEKTMGIIATGDYAGSAAAEWEKITNTLAYNANVSKVIWSDFIQNTFGRLLPLLSAILGPINKVFGAITVFLGKHPMLGKFIAGFIALTGVLLIVGGATLFFVGKLATLQMTMAAAGMTAGGVLTGGIKSFGIAMSTVKPMITSFLKQALSLALVFGSIYFLWKYDIFGIRSTLESFTSGVKTAFENAKQLVSKNAVSIKAELANLDVSNNFIDRLTAFGARLLIVWDSIRDMWTDYTISDDLYEKLVASGMEPFVTKFMMLVFRIRKVWEGFGVGFTSVTNGIKNVFTTVFKPIVDGIGKAITFVMDKLIEWGMIESKSKALDENIDKWVRLGDVLGKISAAVLTLFAVSKVFSLISKPVKGVSSAFAGIQKLLGKGGGASQVADATSQSASSFARVPKPSSILKGMADIGIIIGGVALIVTAFALLSRIPGFNEFIKSGVNTLGILLTGMAKLALQIGVLALLTTVLSKVSPKTLLSGIASLATVLGGFTLIISAYGLLAMIPGFNNFLLSGAT